MSKLNEKALALFQTAPYWLVATASNEGKPNCVPIGLKKITDDGQIIVYPIFMDVTLENLSQNKNIALTAVNAQNGEAYQIKGVANLITEGDIVEAGNTMASKMNLKVKGAIVVDMVECFIQSPGPDNGKSL